MNRGPSRSTFETCNSRARKLVSLDYHHFLLLSSSTPFRHPHVIVELENRKDESNLNVETRDFVANVKFKKKKKKKEKEEERKRK